MDRALAQKHGAPYIHLAAFAIDVDRVRELLEAADLDGEDAAYPFGWEVLITERYLTERFDPIHRPEQVSLLEDVVLGVLEGDPDALGGQVAFAIWSAIRRERFPARLSGAFASWREEPVELADALDALVEREGELVRGLAAACLETAIDPPLAPPTADALRALMDDASPRSPT